MTRLSDLFAKHLRDAMDMELDKAILMGDVPAPKDLNGNPVPGGILQQSGRQAGKTKISDLFPVATTSGNGITFPTVSADKAVTNDRQIVETINTLGELARHAPAVVRQTLEDQIDALDKERIARNQHDQDPKHPVHDVPVGDMAGVEGAIADAAIQWDNNTVALRVEWAMGMQVRSPESFVVVCDPITITTI